MTQRVEPLADDHRMDIEKQRHWVYGKNSAADDFPSAETKLDLLDAMLKSTMIKANHKWELQSLGVVFGDALAQQLGLLWVTVEDEFGRDPALLVPKTTILAYPLTAISKRIEDGEGVDVFDLFQGFCELIEKRKADFTFRD
jgi:hypothetical protein